MVTNLKVGDRVKDNCGFVLVIQDVTHAHEGLYWGGYEEDRFPWGDAAPKRHVRIDTANYRFVIL